MATQPLKTSSHVPLIPSVASSSAAVTAVPATQQPKEDAPPMLEVLIERAQQAQEQWSARIAKQLDVVAKGQLSTADMLRLQVAMGEFSIGTQVMTQVSEKVSSAIQTLMQRS